MATRPRIIAGIAALVLVALTVATAIGAQRQTRSLAAQLGRLSQAGRAEGAATVSTHPADELPAPVARYLSLVLPKPKLIEEVRLRQVGTLRTDVNGTRWMSFDADHVVVPPATGFVWDARVRVAPLLHVPVRDALNRRQVRAGQPGVGIHREQRRWHTGDALGFAAPLSDGFKQVAWEGHFRNYRRWDGVLVPTEGDVGWYVNDEWHVVWKGTITGFEIRTER